MSSDKDEVQSSASIQQDSASAGVDEETSDSTADQSSQQQPQPPQQSPKVESESSERQESSDAAKIKIEKIEVRLQPTGDAPIMKKRKWAVKPQQTVGQINKFVRGYLKLDEKENLFMYVNQAFAPSPDQTVQNLYDCFGSDGNLVLHYSKNQAWG